MKLEVFLNIKTFRSKDNSSIPKYDKKSGLYIISERTEKCNSFVRNFNINLCGILLQNTTIQAVDTNGTLRTVTGGGNTGGVNRLNMTPGVYGAGNITGGILLGRGTSPTTIDMYKMESLITSGIGSGQLSYEQSNVVGWSTSGSTSWWELSRTVINGTGSDVTVTEVGAVARMTNISSQHFLWERTLLETPEVIGDSETKTFTYKLAITV